MEWSPAIVLFSDASRVDLRRLGRGVGVPLRLLGVGLPLTVILGTLVAGAVFDRLSMGEALIVGVILAPTDAALGQAVVTRPRIPARIRQGLNVESGLNDGICVPLLFAAVAAADIESNIAAGRGARLRHRLVQPAPVAPAMLGSRARLPTLGFLGWFGPRGLASIVFAVIVIEESQLPHEELIVLAVYITVGLSILAHGLSAAPLARRYGDWYQAHPRERMPEMESIEVEMGRARGPRAQLEGHARA